MAYTIKLGTFSKLENSTAQPVTTGWAEYSVVFKNGTDLDDPEVSLNITQSAALSYNYAEMFGRYYWIRNRIMERNDYCTLFLELDILATYKNEIGSSSLYVLRSAFAADGNVRDNYYPMDGTTTRERYTCSTGAANPFATGVYVVNVMGMQTGTSTLYQFTPAQFSALINRLMVVADGFDLTDVIDQIKNALYKPMNYINSVMWFPEAFSASAISASNFYVGYWPGNTACSQITDPVKHMNAGVAYNPTVFKHPQASSRGDYLNLAPYSEYNLVFPPFGIIPIDTTMLQGSSYFNVDLYVDALTGMGILRGRVVEGSGDEAVLFEVSAQYGVQLPLLANGNSGSLSGSIATISGLAAGAITGGIGTAALVAGAAEAGISGIEDAIIGTTSTIGSNGSIVAHTLPKYLDCIFHNVVDGDNTHNGRPLCEVRQISTLSGYIIVSEGDVSIPAPIPVQQKLKGMLESGFFYE